MVKIRDCDYGTVHGMPDAVKNLENNYAKLRDLCEEMSQTVRQFDRTYDYSPPCLDWQPKAKCSNMARRVLAKYEQFKKTGV